VTVLDVRNRSSSAMGASFEGEPARLFWLIVDVLVLTWDEVLENQRSSSVTFWSRYGRGSVSGEEGLEVFTIYTQSEAKRSSCVLTRVLHIYTCPVFELTSRVAGWYSGMTSAHSTATDRFARVEKSYTRSFPVESLWSLHWSPQRPTNVFPPHLATSNHSLNVRDADVGKIRADRLVS